MHALGSAAAVLMILVLSFLPFLPGRYDSAAAPLFGIAQIISFLSLLLVPIGAAWLGLGRRMSTTGHRRFAIGTLSAATIIWLLVSFAMLAFGTFSLGLLGVAFWVSVLVRARAALRDVEHFATRSRVWALSLVIAPLVLAGAHVAFVGKAIDFSRDRAMRNAERMIAAIEQYRAANGRYPTSTLAEIPDYQPGVIGIERYHYEPHFEAYNLVFEQLSNIFGTREFVVYNPRDEQVFTAHQRDILEMTPAQLALDRTRGHYATVVATRPHWKYFRFD